MDRSAGMFKHLPYTIWILFGGVLLSFVIGGTFFYRSQEEHLRGHEKKELTSIAELKVGEIARWLQERKGDAAVALSGPYFSAAIERYLREPGPVLAAQIVKRMNSYREHYGYEAAFLVDVEGEIRLTAGPEEKELGPETAEKFRQALRQGEPLFSDFYYCSHHNTVHLDLITPLFPAGDSSIAPVGALILRIDPHKFLFPLIQSWPTISKTAETLLVRGDGDDILYLNELRHRKGSALKLRIPLSRFDVPAVRAVRGEEGIVEGLDYRGVPVLAVLEQVPDSPWYLVAKIDADEAFAAWRFRATAIIVGFFLLLGLSFAGIGFYWYRQQARHLEEMHVTHEKLRESEERYRFLSGVTMVGVLLHRDGVAVDLNDALARMFGWPLEELRGKNFLDFLHPDDLPIALDQMKKEYAAPYTVRLIRRDGGMFYGEIESRNHQRENSRWRITIVRDITDRKRAEEALRQSEEKFQKAFHASPDTLIITRASDGHIVEVNKGFTDMSGYTKEEALGSSTVMMELWADPAQRDRVVATLREKGTIRDLETRFRIKDGGLIDCVYAGVIIQLHGEPHVVSIVRDITDRKKLEAVREELIAALQDKNEEMESLLYAASHDLRTPLVNIQGFSDRIGKYLKELKQILDAGLSAEEMCAMAAPLIKTNIPKALGYVTASTDKMDALIQGILKLSRLGRSTHEPGPVDLNALIRETLDALKFQTQEAGALITVADLPSCWGDRREIGQAFSNLIDNAIKYRDPARPLVIRIAGTAMGDRVVYSVEDTGIGIKKGHQEQIWGLFSRLDPSGPVAGEGIGLTMVKRIIQRNRGKIWMESDPGRGSAFYILLPCDRKAAGRIDSVFTASHN